MRPFRYSLHALLEVARSRERAAHAAVAAAARKVADAAADRAVALGRTRALAGADGSPGASAPASQFDELDRWRLRLTGRHTVAAAALGQAREALDGERLRRLALERHRAGRLAIHAAACEREEAAELEDQNAAVLGLPEARLLTEASAPGPTAARWR